MRADAPEFIPSQVVAIASNSSQNENKISKKANNDQASENNSKTKKSNNKVEQQQQRQQRNRRNRKKKKKVVGGQIESQDDKNSSEEQKANTDEIIIKTQQDHSQNQNAVTESSSANNHNKKSRNKGRRNRRKKNKVASPSFVNDDVNEESSSHYNELLQYTPTSESRTFSHSNTTSEQSKKKAVGGKKSQNQKKKYRSHIRKNERRKSQNQSNDSIGSNFRSIRSSDEKHPKKSIQVHNEELFPSLIPPSTTKSSNIDVIKNTNNDHNEKNTEEDSIWMNVAQSGHQRCIQQQIELQRKKDKLRYEMETFTRMEILRSGGGDNTNDDKQDDEINQQYEEGSMSRHNCSGDGVINNDPNQGSNQGPMQQQYISSKTGWKMNAYKAEKLKERWLRALLEEQQRREEQEQIKKSIIREQKKNQSVILDYGHITNADYSSGSSDSDSSLSSSSSSSDSDDDSSNSFDDSDEKDSVSSTSSTSSTLLQYLDQPYPLHYAIMKNDENAVKDLLLLPPDATSRDFHVSAIELKHMMIGETLRLPSEIDEQIALSILFFAILLHRPSIVRVLLSIGRKYHIDFVTSTLSIDDTNNDFKSTALMIACQYNLDSCVKTLMTYGPRMNIRHPKTGDSVLHIACKYADSSTVQMLLSSSSPQRMICRRNKRGETPMHICCSKGELESFDVLLRSCSASYTAKALTMKDHKGLTPIMSAIEAGDTNLVLHLLSWKSNVRCSDVLSKSCLTLAVRTKAFDMVALLVDCLDSTERFDFSEALCVTLTSFDDDASEGLDIIRLLVNAGADPFSYCTTAQFYDEGDRSFRCGTPISIAVCSGKVHFVACMMDSFFVAQRKYQEERRMDRMLQRRPESYFLVKEKDEHETCQKAGQDAIMTALLLCRRGGDKAERDEILCTNRLGCCLVMFRRGIYLNQCCLDQLIKGLHEDNESLMTSNLLHGNTFKAMYTHNVVSEDRNANFYSRSFASTWSKVLMSLDWNKINDGNCPWYQSQHQMNASQKDSKVKESDECFLLIREKHILAHKSILSAKSSKLEAALRFAQMNGNFFMGKIEIKLEVNPDLVELFLQHCYHGSFISGLSLEPDICCEQLLELYALGQEYLCTSLSLECEMRLLSRNPQKCFCWDCCENLELMNHEVVICNYVTKGPSATLTAENLLGLVTQLEEWDVNQNNYRIQVQNQNGTKVYNSLDILWSTAWILLLSKFPEILRTDSYLTVVHSTMREFSEHHNSEHLECFGDTIGAILLQNCVDALASSAR